jgi:hypothetical protein
MRKGQLAEQEDELLPEYDFSKGIRGKYAAQYADLVLLAPDVAEFFPDSQSVNEALRLLVQIAQRRREAERTGHSE